MAAGHFLTLLSLITRRQCVTGEDPPPTAQTPVSTGTPSIGSLVLLVNDLSLPDRIGDMIESARIGGRCRFVIFQGFHQRRRGIVRIGASPGAE